jgi:hypothetical protein
VVFLARQQEFPAHVFGRKGIARGPWRFEQEQCTTGIGHGFAVAARAHRLRARAQLDAMMRIARMAEHFFVLLGPRFALAGFERYLSSESLWRILGGAGAKARIAWYPIGINAWVAR